MDGVRYWGSLPAENSLAGWLEKLRKMGEGSGVLPHYRGSREWGILLGG